MDFQGVRTTPAKAKIFQTPQVTYDYYNYYVVVYTTTSFTTLYLSSFEWDTKRGRKDGEKREFHFLDEQIINHFEIATWYEK